MHASWSKLHGMDACIARVCWQLVLEIALHAPASTSLQIQGPWIADCGWRWWGARVYGFPYAVVSTAYPLAVLYIIIVYIYKYYIY